MRQRKLFATKRILTNTHPKSRSRGDLAVCAFTKLVEPTGVLYAKEPMFYQKSALFIDYRG
jgi:hypothetical protein